MMPGLGAIGMWGTSLRQIRVWFAVGTPDTITEYCQPDDLHANEGAQQGSDSP
jgi:hypothetical protein